MIKSIYVGNLPFRMSSRDVSALFEPFGEVYSVKLIYDRETGRPRGFGFVEMDDVNVQKAVQVLNESDCQGRTLVVSEARAGRQELAPASKLPKQNQQTHAAA